MYVESYVTHKTDIQYTSKYGSMFVFTCALCLSYVWNHPHVIKIVVMDKIKTIISEEHAVSYGVLFVFIFYMIGIYFFLFPLFSMVLIIIVINF